MKDDTQSVEKGSRKALINPLIMVFSAINTGMLIIVKLIQITSQKIGLANIVLGNTGMGVFLTQCP